MSCPIRSGSVSGPSGYPAPPTIAASMSSFVTKPSSYIRMASETCGHMSLFAMNPARSFACTTVSPRVSDVNVAARSAVAPSVRNRRDDFDERHDRCGVTKAGGLQPLTILDLSLHTPPGDGFQDPLSAAESRATRRCTGLRLRIRHDSMGTGPWEGVVEAPTVLNGASARCQRMSRTMNLLWTAGWRSQSRRVRIDLVRRTVRWSALDSSEEPRPASQRQSS